MKQEEQNISIQIRPVELPALCLVTHTYAYAVVHTVHPSPERAEALEWLIGFHDRCQEQNLVLTADRLKKQDYLTISFPIAELLVFGTAIVYYSRLYNLRVAPEYSDLPANVALDYARTFCNRFLEREKRVLLN